MLLTAPTGSSKTETALLWLRQQAQALGAPRLFYVLPNRASLNTMHKRLEMEFSEKTELTAVPHGRMTDLLHHIATGLEASSRLLFLFRNKSGLFLGVTAVGCVIQCRRLWRTHRESGRGAEEYLAIVGLVQGGRVTSVGYRSGLLGVNGRFPQQREQG